MEFWLYFCPVTWGENHKSNTKKQTVISDQRYRGDNNYTDRQEKNTVNIIISVSYKVRQAALISWLIYDRLVTK